MAKKVSEEVARPRPITEVAVKQLVSFPRIGPTPLRKAHITMISTSFFLLWSNESLLVIISTKLSSFEGLRSGSILMRRMQPLWPS
ncbi:hypothetical protein EVAR_43965_1 [Eumeta japonica]|uniref:Uncharacterized protein n=1 Tax=Eumeta variegata TaxID=151549 RepID=A0A4C1Y0Z3_EUMVA|nr:hypothetical protein EVAR_43965_1 [Eumeta japonica]